ncbi:MAG TPA: peptidoglycan-binding domain-containing protein [Steroidobacteraceae bacterium]|nr:peptidoglycan-binding domain-containing protein [Steroidobacteraceae bacterium]
MRSTYVLVISALLVACGGDRPAVMEAQPAEMAPSAPPAEAGESPTGPEEAALVFRVMREGGGGIDATINQVGPQGQASFYATVPGSGVTALDKPCEAGQRFQAEPKVAAFLRGPTQDCAERVEFMLYSTQATLQFIKRGDDASAGGDLLVAQSNYGTAADRLQYAEPEKSRRLRVLSTVAAGRALGVTQPVQGTDGREQPTTEFQERVRVFQRQNGIEATGDLDARTRESIGRMRLRGGAVVVPPAASSGSLGPASAAAVAAAPALVITPQAVTPAVEVRVTAVQMLAAPASPQTAAMIHVNRAVRKGSGDAVR